MPLLLAVLGAALAQDRALDWASAAKRASEADALAYTVVVDPRDQAASGLASDVLKDPAVAKSLADSIEFTGKGRNPHGFRTPAGPYVVFFDHEGKIRGFSSLVTTPDVLAASTTAVLRLWKRHDSLVFLTRSRGTPREIADAAASEAFRLEKTKSKALLARIRSGPTAGDVTWGLEQAWSAYADCCLALGDLSGAEEALSTLERSKNPDRRFTAMLGLARLWADRRTSEAEKKCKTVLESRESSDLLKQFGGSLLKRLTDWSVN